MKRIYKRIEVASSEILLTLALFSDVGGTESVNAADLDRLEAQLSRPNYTGAEKLPIADVQRSHLEITDGGNILAVLHRLKRGENRFVCKARYGTNISVQIMIDFAVTNLNETPVEISENVVLVESIGNGSGQFPTDYAKQGTDPDATLTDTQAYAQSAASDAGAAKTAAEAAKDAALAIVIPSDYAKQGANGEATNTAILEAAQAIVIPTDYSKQGTDPTATNSAILAAVQSISDIESDVQAGRQALATNITAKGVPTSVSDALVTMATKVLQIPQQINTGISEFEQMIAPSPYMWNVYTVATDLMKDTLPQYIPSYMNGGIYAQYRANNAFFVGEYYLGYDTLELSGADGYLTCDGDFYFIFGEAGSRVVTHTLPDGTVETYSAESIIHTWHDGESGYCNRWVGFFYLANAYSFTNITSDICPRRVVLCGECLSFIITGGNRLTDLWVIGSLGHFEGGTTGSTWNPILVIGNYKEHRNGVMVSGASEKTSVIFPELETLSGGVLFQKYSTFTVAYLPNLKSILNGAYLFDTNEEGSTSSSVYCGANILILPALQTCNGRIANCSAVSTRVRKLYCPELVSIGSFLIDYMIYQTNQCEIEEIHCPKIKSIKTFANVGNSLISSTLTISTTNRYCPNLIDIEVGELTTNLYCIFWNPNYLSNATKKAQLIENIKNHILARVSDRTGNSQLVFTVRAAMYNAISGENIEWQGQTMTLADAFLTKNWLFAGA